MNSSPTRRRLAALAALPLMLAACSGTGSAEETPEPSPTQDVVDEGDDHDHDHTDDHDHDHDHDDDADGSAVSEVAAVTARLAVTYDGGVQVLDAATLQVVETIEVDGFNRLNPAGDGRHLLLSTTGGFQVLDLGTWAEPHGDHAHNYTSAPELTDTLYAAERPGHVVVHEGRVALFDDGTGEVVVLDSAEIAEDAPETRDHTTAAPHHGVAVELSDGTFVVSEGTEEARTGIRVLDADGEELASSAECPGVHGEAMAQGEVVVIGCEDGALIVSGGQITKVTSPDDYGRIGNQAGSAVSPIVLGDYKTEQDAELERPTRVALIDTRTAELTLVDLPASYTFRSLARGDDGEALVLGTDGNLHVIDPETGELTASHPVIEPWEEPLDWQEPRPAILALDGSVYITDPASGSIHAVDVLTGEVWSSVQLDVVPNEIDGVSGDVEHGSTEHGDHEHDHDHDHDHEHDHDHDHGGEEDHDHDHDDHDH